MNSNIKTYFALVFSACLAGIIAGCNKFVQIPPPTTSITGPTVYTNNKSAAAAMTSIYVNMMSTGHLSGGLFSISTLEGYGADELTNYSTDPSASQFYTNALGSSNVYFWQEIYSDIYLSNAVLEGLNSSSGLSDSIKNQLIGEAKFMRAFLHFYATNMYGDVPLVLSTDYQANNTLHRTPQVQVYQQIIADLSDAQTKLSDHFVDYQGLLTTERTRPNRGAATALLARVYLYEQKWDSAFAESSMLLSNSQYSLDNTLTDVFLANSNEAIWQLQPVVAGVNTYDAPYFVLTADPGTQSTGAISPYLLKAFEPNDSRFTSWVGTFIDPSTNDTFYYPFKYQVYLNPSPLTEYLMVFRLAEQYLIRAEAEAHGSGNGIPDAISDLNVIRARAGLQPYAGATDMGSVLSAILHERQVEMFTEWGHRWFDLKRTNSLDSVLGSPGNITAQKGGSWNSNWALIPLPQSELQINQNLTQNPGY